VASSVRPFIPVPDCLEAELRFQLGSVVMTNRLVYAVNPFGHFPASQLDFAGALGTSVINRYLPAVANNVLFTRVRTRTMSSSSDPWTTIDYTGYFGTWPSEALAANCTCFIRSRIGRQRGVKRGALCFPAPPRSAVVENRFTDEWIFYALDAVAFLISIPGTFGYELNYVSYRSGNAWRTEGVPIPWGVPNPDRTVAPRRRRLRNTNIFP